MNQARTPRSLAAILLASLAFATSVKAQSLPVDVDITVESGGVAILNYYASIDVSLNPADLVAILNEDGCPPSLNIAQCAALVAGNAGLAAPSPSGPGGGQLRADGALAVGATPTGNLRNVTLDLDNVWAVRAVGGTQAFTTVSILIGGDTELLNAVDPNSKIVIGGADVYLMVGGGSPSASVDVDDIGLLTPTYGGVQLTLDLEAALLDGVYSTAGDTGDDNYLIGITGT